ncbi:uncharacterized protein LOC122005252 isoform X2 [Zingiber officinale]|uniref:uncharacterized protein LOC122005252 isoform X2 n=1 Tax=Zingiber officinale TaxID=94328 RepID=UPI001C4CBBA4|nr:uncharacterized protein LOC122005252 isoform X2 [Zingiber officinale]
MQGELVAASKRNHAYWNHGYALFHDLPLYTSSCMGSFSCLDTLPEYAIADLHEYCVSCEKFHATVEVCACLNNNQSTGVTNMRIPNVPSICSENMITIHGVDGSHALILSINDLQGQLSIDGITSDEKILEPKKTETHENLCLPADWKPKALAKSTTFPSTLVADVSDLYIGDTCSLLSTEFSNQCSPTKANPTYARSMSLPVPPKLISAMKGSRVQHGSPSDLKLHVKWALDVYDPPCTLLSHTVKNNHHQLPKARKNYNNKHKHKHKAKSARASNNDRRTAKRIINNKTESLNARLQSTRMAGLLNDYGKSSTEGVEYTVSNQDSKCGGSFLVQALAKVNISSVTEVT